MTAIPFALYNAFADTGFAGSPTGQAYDTSHIAHASPSQLQGLTADLLQQGFHESEIRGILEENFYRIAEQGWS